MRHLEPGANGPSARLLFVHIQKTAGQTFRAILQKKYGTNRCLEIGNSAHHTPLARVINMSEREKDGFDCVMAHLPFGLHTLFDKPYHYITLLRDPLERSVSQFFYICRTPTNACYRLVERSGFSLLSYVEHDEFGRPDNMQIRYIIDRFDKEWMDAGDLSQAKTALLENFTLFGITERFKDSVRLFERKLGWGKTPFRSKNVTPNRPTLSALAAKAINRLYDRNHLDILLYKFALKQFGMRTDAV